MYLGKSKYNLIEYLAGLLAWNKNLSLSYQVIFNEDPATHTCKAVYECFTQISEWEYNFYTNEDACPANKIEKVTL